jgi:hypothetical protein
LFVRMFAQVHVCACVCMCMQLRIHKLCLNKAEIYNHNVVNTDNNRLQKIQKIFPVL